MHQSRERVQSLDFLRGFAVVVMVLGHSIDAVLSTDVRATEVFRIYDALRGFTAPLFLFISGFAFAVVTGRRWEVFAAFGSPARKRVGKMAGLLVLGYMLHFPFFSLNKLLHNTRPEEYAMMFQVDILHCLAVSIIMLQLLVVITRTPERFLRVTAAAGTLIVLLSPLIWLLDLRGALPPAIAPSVPFSRSRHISLPARSPDSCTCGPGPPGENPPSSAVQPMSPLLRPSPVSHVIFCPCTYTPHMISGRPARIFSPSDSE
jgi:hypothetical protein